MTIKPWHPNEPLADDNLSDSQPKLQQNTNTIQSILEKSMLPFGDPNAGLFKQIDLQNITTLPPAVSGFGGIYNLNNKLTFRDGNGNLFTVPIDINTFNQGYLNIGGFIIQMGTAFLNKNLITKVNFPLRFPIECRIVVTDIVKGGGGFPSTKIAQWFPNYFEINTNENTNITWVAFGR